MRNTDFFLPKMQKFMPHVIIIQWVGFLAILCTHVCLRLCHRSVNGVQRKVQNDGCKHT